MIKLFTLENISAFSSDAVYKICLALEDFGLLEENLQGFETYDALLNAACFAAEDGDNAIIAVEPGDFNIVKRNLIAKLNLEEETSSAVSERIEQYAAENDLSTDEIDEAAHAAVAQDSTLHLTEDGLYSGFTVQTSAGTVTLLPLDFSRVDAALESMIAALFAPEEAQEEEVPQEDPQVPTVDFATPARKVVAALSHIDRRLALATGDAVSWLTDLRDTVDGFDATVDFVTVPDPMPDETGHLPEETPAATVLRQAREARISDGADYGAAISGIYSDESSGTPTYFAVVAVSDSIGTKAKKITTTNEDDLQLMLPHCIMVLFETICQKAENSAVLPEVRPQPKKQPEQKEKKVPKGLIAFAAVILVAAIVVPILWINGYLKKEEPTTTVPTDQGDLSSTLPTLPTSALPDVTSGGNYVAPAEPGATDVSATPTSAPAPSTSGVFTFYVFGYGHGVGLSQHGADYLASLGWDYAQILANYYYGTTLVTGDQYPATINYDGTDYNTREFLATVLESEMGGTFKREALKAQAVAIYTFAKYNNFKLNADANAFGKTPSQLCQEVADEVIAAGLYISYNGRTALTPFHSISAGKTTSYANVWSGSADLPYLGGGRPSYGDYNAPDFKSFYSISSADFKAIASQKLSVELTGDPATWISIVSHDQALDSNIGYVSSINVGGKIITGNEFRIQVMEGKLRSHCFYLVYTPDGT